MYALAVQNIEEKLHISGSFMCIFEITHEDCLHSLQINVVYLLVCLYLCHQYIRIDIKAK